MEAGGWGVQGYPWLRIKFEGSLSYNSVKKNLKSDFGVTNKF